MDTVFICFAQFKRLDFIQKLTEEHGVKIEWLCRDFLSESHAGSAETYKTLLARAEEIEFLIPDLTRLDRKFFEAAKNLKLVAVFGVGIDHVDLAAATDNGVLVTNVPGGNAPSVAEHVLGIMLALGHKLALHNLNLKKGLWLPGLGTEINGKTLGIVGLGNIGQRVAKLGAAFGMKLIAANRTPRPDLAAKLGVTLLPLETVLGEADYLSLHIPAGSNSWHFGAKEFALMKPSACLINTARGGILDLDALTTALGEGRLAGAGLDVFPDEPMNLAHPVFALEQVVVTPHTGGMTKESRYRQLSSCLGECTRVRKRERSPNALNQAVYSLPAWQGDTRRG